MQITLSPLAKQSPFDREKSSLQYLTVEARDDSGKGNRNNVELVNKGQFHQHFTSCFCTNRFTLILLGHGVEQGSQTQIYIRGPHFYEKKSSRAAQGGKNVSAGQNRT